MYPITLYGVASAMYQRRGKFEFSSCIVRGNNRESFEIEKGTHKTSQSDTLNPDWAHKQLKQLRSSIRDAVFLTDRVHHRARIAPVVFGVSEGFPERGLENVAAYGFPEIYTNGWFQSKDAQEFYKPLITDAAKETENRTSLHVECRKYVRASERQDPGELDETGRYLAAFRANQNRSAADKQIYYRAIEEYIKSTIKGNEELLHGQFGFRRFFRSQDVAFEAFYDDEDAMRFAAQVLKKEMGFKHNVVIQSIFNDEKPAFSSVVEAIMLDIYDGIGA